MGNHKIAADRAVHRANYARAWAKADKQASKGNPVATALALMIADGEAIAAGDRFDKKRADRLRLKASENAYRQAFWATMAGASQCRRAVMEKGLQRMRNIAQDAATLKPKRGVFADAAWRQDVHFSEARAEAIIGLCDPAQLAAADAQSQTRSARRGPYKTPEIQLAIDNLDIAEVGRLAKEIWSLSDPSVTEEDYLTMQRECASWFSELFLNCEAAGLVALSDPQRAALVAAKDKQEFTYLHYSDAGDACSRALSSE